VTAACSAHGGRRMPRSRDCSRTVRPPADSLSHGSACPVVEEGTVPVDGLSLGRPSAQLRFR
jgi:hypothetical protein